ncbi:hypothetical protein BV20DRAFT_451484 [Pilatotrama ljubarskyi]|nr:hypothetical protein BV20DRAFT_451484 [Pilatotrama ljubarskyi]
MHITLTPPTKPRHSLEVFDRLIERAFAPRPMHIASPIAPPEEIERPRTPEPPQTPLDMPDEEFTEPSPAQQTSLNTVWEEVLSTKEKELAASPSKVKSLEGAVLSTASATTELRHSQVPPPPKRKVAKRRSR